MTVAYVTRSQWGARTPTHTRKLDVWSGTWFLHWLGMGYPPDWDDDRIARAVQNYHMDKKGWSDIAYSFGVGRTARAYELRGWNIAGGHTRHYNRSTMAIVFFVGKGERITLDMMNTANAILADGEQRGYPTKRIKGHRDAATTECPGDQIYELIVRGAFTPKPKADNDDMLPRQIHAVRQLQTALHEAGYDLGATGIDGDPGTATVAAVTDALKDLSDLTNMIAHPSPAAALRIVRRALDQLEN